MAQLKPLLLHAHPTGPNPLKIAVMLELLQLSYDVKLWALGSNPGGIKSGALRDLNPNERLPILEDPNTDVTSWESGAVINYLLREYDGGNKFGPRGGKQEQVDFEKWNLFLLTNLGPMIG